MHTCAELIASVPFLEDAEDDFVRYLVTQLHPTVQSLLCYRLKCFSMLVLAVYIACTLECCFLIVSCALRKFSAGASCIGSH